MNISRYVRLILFFRVFLPTKPKSLPILTAIFAAGVAAAIALSHGENADAVPYEGLREALALRGVRFEVFGTKHEG